MFAITSMKIFYDTDAFKHTQLSNEDVGVFFDMNDEFRYKQYIITHHRYVNRFSYEEFIQELYDKNEKLFRLESKNISKNMSNICTSFLIKTYKFFNHNSVGNYLSVIDIFSDIIKNNPGEEMNIYIPEQEDIIQVIKKVFKKHKVKKYNFITGKKKRRIPLSFLKEMTLARIFIRYLGKVRAKKVDESKDTVILEPTGSENSADIFKNVKPVVEDYEILNYESKNEMKRLNTIPRLFSRKYHKHYSQFYTLKHFFKIRSLQKKKIKQLKNYRIKKIAYKDIDITAETQRFLEVLFKTYLQLVIDGILMANKICEKYKRVIFSYNENPFLEAINTNQNKNCKKYSLQYEMIYPGSAYTIINHQKLRIKKELVWNQYTKDCLIESYNYPEEKVEVIGNIRFPKIKKTTHENINITFATQGEYFQAVTDFFIDSCKYIDNKNLKLQIKPHPSEDYSQIKKNILNTNIKFIKGDIREALSITDIMITYCSTVALEAIYNNIPVIIINPYENQDPHGMPYYKHFDYFKKEKEFVRFLDSIYMNKLKSIKTPDDWIIEDFKKDKFKKIIY